MGCGGGGGFGGLFRHIGKTRKTDVHKTTDNQQRFCNVLIGLLLLWLWLS